MFVHLVGLAAGSHHLSQLVEPEPLVVDLVGGLLQVLHVVGQHQVPQGQEVAVILWLEFSVGLLFRIFARKSIY